MDIYNDTEKLKLSIKNLNISINNFYDINSYIYNMISRAKNSLEGNRMDIMENTLISSTNDIRDMIDETEDGVRFLEELGTNLEKYFNCKFEEDY